MYKKKLLIVALSAAFAAPGAFAQKGGGGGKGSEDADSVVVLYGKIYPEIVRPSGEGATEAGTTGLATFAGTPTGRTGIIRRNEMESGNSRLGVRGHEKLGGGMKAIFQLETEFHVDSNDSRFAQRDSFVGLAHDRWGTVKLGRMDTPFKGYGDEISFLGISSGNITSTSNVLRTVGFGGSSAASRERPGTRHHATGATGDSGRRGRGDREPAVAADSQSGGPAAETAIREEDGAVNHLIAQAEERIQGIP